MQQLLKFLYRYRSIFTFLIFEIICFVLIIRNNRHQSTVFFNSSNFISSRVLSFTSGVSAYFNLDETNAIIAEENALLRAKLEKLKSLKKDSSGIVKEDSTLQYEFITAKIINNSTQWQNNTLTIDKGVEDGINIGMGVLGSGGIVGKVRYTNNRYSVLTSLLHSGFTISSRIKDKVELCTVEWNGRDPGLIEVKFVPRHHSIKIGDSVLTSGYNAIFPANIAIAVISDIQLESDDTFYSLQAKLVNDFTKLSYVHVVMNRYKVEKDSIENLVIRDE